MKNLKLFLVGGFLGSGKTTAIYNAAKQLIDNKKKVGVITNDQGTRQVDTLFIRSCDIASQEVSGGCFCCNYDDLEQSIRSLEVNEQPDVIFAESVGSCADLAATVVNPLLTFNPGKYEIVLSVFADIRLLIKFLQNDRNIFHDSINYIYEKQLEEADIIVVNKTDLLTQKQTAVAKKLIAEFYGSRTILYQNSLSKDAIEQWLMTCGDIKNSLLRRSLEIDYNEYAAGEAKLAWLDEEIRIVTKDNTAVSAGYELILKIYDTIREEGYPVGHLKFLIDDGKIKKKISFNSIALQEANDWDQSETDRVIILINVRIQARPDLIRKIVADAIIATELLAHCKISETGFSAFVPDYPKPTHRLPA
jgi:Ni2+-binding GTPase involved in maturation of urease and hydrogenase